MSTFGNGRLLVPVLSLLVAVCGPVVAQDAFTVEAAIESLEEFESSLWGLQFDEIMIMQPESEDRVTHIEVSSDGEIRRTVGTVHDGEGEVEGSTTSWRYINSREGFAFSAVRRVYDSPKMESMFGCAVRFYTKEQTPFGGGGFGWPHGFIDDMSMAEFVRRADVEVTNREFRGKSYRALICRLEKRPELTLLFDESNRWRGYEERIVEGDVIPAEYRYDDPQVAQPGEWVTLWGALEQYDQVGDREVLIAWERGVTTSGGIVSSARYKRTNIRELDAPLGSKISFPDLTIENGTDVSCDGRQALVYVYRDGKLYLAADSASVDAARRSRWWRSVVGSPWYYTLGLLGFLGIFALIIYLRNRDT